MMSDEEPIDPALAHLPRALRPDDPQHISINFINVDVRYTPMAYYDGLEMDTTVGQILRRLEQAGCYILSVAYNGGVLDVRLIASQNDWLREARTSEPGREVQWPDRKEEAE